MLDIGHQMSSAYHPESQGALERFHQTLKALLQCYCTETGRDWAEGLPYLMFATRETVQESLGFSPAELVFGHTMRGPLKLLSDQLLSQSPKPVPVLMSMLPPSVKSYVKHEIWLSYICLQPSQK